MDLRTFLCAFLSVLYAFSLVGQSPTSSDFKKVSANYTVSKIDLGISDKQIGLRYSMKDSTGYLWMSSQKGLTVTNGEEALHYDNGAQRFPLLNDSVNSHISYMRKDKNQNLIMTFVDEDVILRYNPYTREIIDTLRVATKLPTIDVVAAEALDGGLVYITGDGVTAPLRLYKENKDGVHSLLFQAPAEDGVLETVASLVTTHNQYLIFTSNNIYCLNAHGKLLKKVPNGEGEERFRFSEKVNGNVYFVAWFTHEIYYWDSQSLAFKLFFEGAKKMSLPARFFLTDERYVVLSNEQHLWVYDLQNKTYQDLMPIYREYITTYTNYKTPPSFVRGIIEDNGNLLLNGANHLFRFTLNNEDASSYKEHVFGLDRQPSMRQLAEGEDGTLYVCYYVGVAKKKINENIFYPIDIPQKPKKRISSYSLSLYDNSIIWDNQLIDLKSNFFDITSQAKTLGHTAQYRKEDSLWSFAWWTDTFSWYDLNTKKRKSYPFKKGNFVNIDIEMINETISDNQNKHLWIATLKNGICYLSKQGNILKQYTPEFLGMNAKSAVYDVWIEGDIIWYAGNVGLGSINIKTEVVEFQKFQYTSNEEELLNRQVYFIEPLNTSQFYLGTDHGILLFDKEERTYLELNHNHPMEDLEFNRASHFKSSEGKYYMGTTSGLYSFYPDQLKWNEEASNVRVRIDEVAIFNNEGNHRFISEGVNDLGEVKIQPIDTSIEVLCSSVKDKEDIFYSYRIKGLTDNWSTYTSEGRISLLGLPAGNFTLEMRNNVAPQLVKTLKLNKSEFWHKRWYIQLAVLTIFSLLAFGFMRYRYQQRLTKEKEMIGLRNKISSDLHDDVGTILASVAMQSEIMERKALPEQKEKLVRIGSLSREAMSRMRDMVWSIDSRKDNSESLLSRMKDYARDLFNDHESMSFTFLNTAEISSELQLNPNVRQNVYLIFKEAMANAIKHSNGDMVTVSFQHNKKHLYLEVTDNGKVNAPLKVSGLGLTNIDLRARKIDGVLKIISTNGFSVQLTVPLT